jgi:hypothetical protein
MTTASVQFDRLLERITTHLRELIARLQIELIRRWCRALVSNQNGGVVQPPIASPPTPAPGSNAPEAIEVHARARGSRAATRSNLRITALVYSRSASPSSLATARRRCSWDAGFQPDPARFPYRVVAAVAGASR